MAFGTQDDTDEVMNEINVTPMVDVMLVLLIIFIITVPVLKNSVNIDLPRASSQPLEAKPETIELSVDAQGNYFWNATRTGDKELAALLKTAALRNPQPELHILGDKAVR
ncbi:MAG: biopolymer transporter ExbD, partial [Burkholderiaceae bacterium]